MEELRHGTEEMTQYIVTLGTGKQIRLFVSADDWQDEYQFLINVANYCDAEHITRYSVESITVE